MGFVLTHFAHTALATFVQITRATNATSVSGAHGGADVLGLVERDRGRVGQGP